MPLKQLMTAHVELIHPDTPVHEAARVMRLCHIGALPVCEGSQLQGILTERDLVARVLAEGRDPTRTTVRDVMTAELMACTEDQDRAEALRLMQERQIRHLAVVDRAGRLVGLLSLRDLAPPLREGQLAGSAIRWPASRMAGGRATCRGARGAPPCARWEWTGRHVRKPNRPREHGAGMASESRGGGRHDHPSGGKADAPAVRRISGRPPDAVIHTYAIIAGPQA